MAYTHSPKEPIAIIGSGCRFPGDSTSPSKFWELLHSPRDLSKEIPSETRFNADGFYHPNGERHGSSNVTMSYFIEEDPRFFDAGFFGIAPREAEAIDPQQRLLLETVYEAMENAGLTLQGLKGSMTSAYVGAMSADYTDTQTRDVENLSQYMITGTSRALLSNRLSYFFDWHGPSISVEPTRDIGVSLAPFLPIEEHEAEGDNPSAEDIGQRDILTDQEGFALQILFNDPEIEIVDLGNRFDSDGPRLVALQ